MLTLGDLNRTAQMKKAAREAMAAVGPMIHSAADKVKHVAEVAKEVVTGAFPVSNKALDERTQQLLILHAGLEQRVDGLEEATGHKTEVNVEQVAVRVDGLFAQMKERKAKDKPIVETSVAHVEKVSPPRADAAPKIRGIRFDEVPRNK